MAPVFFISAMGGALDDRTLLLEAIKDLCLFVVGIAGAKQLVSRQVNEIKASLHKEVEREMAIVKSPADWRFQQSISVLASACSGSIGVKPWKEDGVPARFINRYVEGYFKFTGTSDVAKRRKQILNFMANGEAVEPRKQILNFEFSAQSRNKNIKETVEEEKEAVLAVDGGVDHIGQARSSGL